MSGEFVSWQDYGHGMSPQTGDGMIGGQGNTDDVLALQKALSAGSDLNNPGTAAGAGFPLRVESLDSTLYNVTYRNASDLKFWASLYKDAAYNTVEEFNRLKSYGSGVSAFMSEGDLPDTDDSTYERDYVKIRFMGTVRKVTHVMSLLRAAHGDIVARETVNGTMFLLRQLERTLFDGDEDLMPVQFNGLEKSLAKAFGSSVLADGQHAGYEDDNVIDLRGKPLTEDHIADLVERIISEPNYGAPTDLWMPTGPVRDLSKIMYPKERYDLPAPQGGMAGIAIKGITTPFGNISLNPDIFIPSSNLASATQIGTSSSVPVVPVSVTGTTPVSGSDTSYFGASDAGSYYYKVVAVNRYGKSTPVDSALITGVVADDKVELTITKAASGTAPSLYEIYRSKVGGTLASARLIFKVAYVEGATQVVTDLNRFLPDCSKGYMLTQSSEVLKWKQLAPFTKIPLATIDSSIRWMQVLYGGLMIMAPKKCGMYINVGNLETGAYGS
jgi:hypothetical protein